MHLHQSLYFCLSLSSQVTADKIRPPNQSSTIVEYNELSLTTETNPQARAVVLRLYMLPEANQEPKIYKDFRFYPVLRVCC
jgi:hypothetical protein